jgi:amino acid transporter
MQNLGITVLPDITNALMVTSIFSAGNSYVYCASRTLYGLALDGHAPKFFRKTTKNGIPIWCFIVTMAFPFLSFLSVSSGASEGLKWLANLTQASQVLDYCFMCITYLFFYRAMKVQGYDRNNLPCKPPPHIRACHVANCCRQRMGSTMGRYLRVDIYDPYSRDVRLHLLLTRLVEYWV